MKKFIVQLIILLAVLVSCKKQSVATTSKSEIIAQDPLPSWNEGKSKSAIIEFVTQTTKEGSSDFIPVSDRIACFDNDGTLWSEQPIYFQFLFAIDRIKAMATEHPEWKTKQPFKAVL